MNLFFKHCAGAVVAGLATLSFSAMAQAGGLEANGYDWGLLFNPGTYVVSGSGSYVHPWHDIQSGGTTIETTGDQLYYNFGVKADLGDMVSCLGSAQNPWGSNVSRTLSYAAINGKAAAEKLTSTDLGLTCAVKLNAGPGIVDIIGGVSGQNLNYHADLPTSLTTSSPLDISGWGMGWRVGAAYEIPKYALRVQGIYNAPVSVDLSGSAYGVNNATASVTAPQSFELKAQSGVAPGWLVMGSVKWTDWSVLQALTVNTVGGPVTSTLKYRDGWTVSAGVGHAITKQLGVLGKLTWDRGTSTPNSSGVLLAGTQTDRLGATFGAAYDISDSAKLTAGVSLSALASGSNVSGESWGTGYVLAVGGGLTGHFN